MKPPYKLRSRVKELRTAERNSLRFVAALTGITVSRLRSIEAGADPRLSEALALARYLERPVTEIWEPAEGELPCPDQDPRLHGPPTCPVAPAGCEACSGQHHWIESGFDPTALDQDDEPDPAQVAVAAYDREHGTEHALAYYACKHCPAWCEAEYVWEVLEEEDGEGFTDE